MDSRRVRSLQGEAELSSHIPVSTHLNGASGQAPEPIQPVSYARLQLLRWSWWSIRSSILILFHEMTITVQTTQTLACFDCGVTISTQDRTAVHVGSDPSGWALQ
jgi:hypothetical protein